MSTITRLSIMSPSDLSDSQALLLSEGICPECQKPVYYCDFLTWTCGDHSYKLHNDNIDALMDGQITVEEYAQRSNQTVEQATAWLEASGISL